MKKPCRIAVRIAMSKNRRKGPNLATLPPFRDTTHNTSSVMLLWRRP
jgi:hypothetical protein